MALKAHVWDRHAVSDAETLRRWLEEMETASAVGGAGADVGIFLDDSGAAVAAGANGSRIPAAADHSSVIQAAWDTLKGVPASTLRLNGVYTLLSALTGYCGTNVIGNGCNATTNSNGTLLKSDLDGDLITLIQDPTGTNYFAKLSRFAMAGNVSKTSQRGIVLSDSGGAWQDLFIDEMIVNFIGSVGFYVNAATVKAWISKFYVEFCTSHGVQVNAASRLNFVQSFFGQNTGFGLLATTGYLMLEDSVFEQNAGGALSLNSVIQTLIDGCRFLSNGDSTHPQIDIASMFSTNKALIISGCIFNDTRGASAVTNHIKFSSSHTINADISGNIFTGSQGQAIGCVAQPGFRVNIHDNIGYNDILGKLATPWYTPVGFEAAVAAFTSGSTLTAAPVASTDYFATLGPVYIDSSGGTGVSITIKNGNGDTIRSGLTTFSGVLPFGWTINFGAFSVAPTTTVSVV